VGGVEGTKDGQGTEALLPAGVAGGAVVSGPCDDVVALSGVLEKTGTTASLIAWTRRYTGRSLTSSTRDRASAGSRTDHHWEPSMSAMNIPSTRKPLSGEKTRKKSSGENW